MSFEQVKSALSTAGELLGVLIWWSLSDATIERAALEAKWQGAGLATSLLPEPSTAEKAMKLAVRESQVGLSEKLIRLGKETEEELVFAVVQETKHIDGSVTYTQEAKVRLDRQSELLTDDNPAHPQITAIRSAYLRLRTMHTPDDVRRSMLRLLDACAAVSLREHGGVYWVPAPFADQVRKLQQAIESIGHSRIYLLPVHRSSESERTLGEVAKASIEAELLQLQAQMVQFMSEPPARASTLVKKLEVFEDLKNRAELYRSILNVQVSDLDSQLAEATKTVERLLLEKSAA